MKINKNKNITQYNCNNSKLKTRQTMITNHPKPISEMALIVQCGVNYKSDLDKVEKITIDVAREIQKTVPGTAKTFEPFARYHTSEYKKVLLHNYKS